MTRESKTITGSVAARTHTLLLSGTSETHAQLDKVNQSMDRIQQRIEISAKAQRASTQAVETKIHQYTEKVSFQLKMLEEWQENYFPTLSSRSRRSPKPTSTNFKRRETARKDAFIKLSLLFVLLMSYLMILEVWRRSF